MNTETTATQTTATVEFFSAYCLCKPPHLNADNVCACGVSWAK